MRHHPIRPLRTIAITALAALVLTAVPVPAHAEAATPQEAVFTDPFDALGAPWHRTAGEWEARDGAVRVVTPGTPRGSALALSGYRLEDTASVEATLRTESGGATAWVGFTIERDAVTDDYTQSGYTVLVRNNGEVAVIAAAGSSGVRYLGAAPTDARPGAAPVTITAERTGAELTVSIDGAEVLAVSDAAFDGNGVTLAASRDVVAAIDEIVIDGIVAAEEVVPAPADCVPWSGAPDVGGERGAVLNSPERVAAVDRRIEAGTEPQASAYARLLTEVAADLERSPAAPERFFVPFFYNDPTAHRAARDGLQNDADAAYRLALAYRISDDERYGTHAASFLDAWTSTIECIRTSEDSALAFSYHFPAFVHAAELLRGTPAWPAEAEARFAGFLRETALPVAGSILHRENNWGSWALETTTASAAYLADTELIDAAADRAVELLEHQIDERGHLPEEVERNNGVGDYGIWYTHFSLMPLLLTAETLAAHGHDLHGYVNARGAGLSDAVAAVTGWVADPATFEYFSGDPADLANVRTIDYLRDAGVVAHSMSYFELAQNHYPSDRLATLIAEEGPMTTIHAAPFLSLTHGGMPVPDPPASVAATVDARCLAGLTLVTVRATNVSAERARIDVAYGGSTRIHPRVAPGRDVLSVFPTGADTGAVTVTATAGSGISQTVSPTFDVTPCTLPWRR